MLKNIIAFTYDALGRKLTETVDYGSFNRTNTYAWQANGQPAAFTGPDGLARTYAYDTAGRLTAMSVGTGMVTLDDFTWTAPGTMTLFIRLLIHGQVPFGTKKKPYIPLSFRYEYGHQYFLYGKRRIHETFQISFPGATRRRPRRPCCPAVGCAPGTWCARRTMASTSSPTAARSSSSRAASTSTPPRSRRPVPLWWCWNTASGSPPARPRKSRPIRGSLKPISVPKTTSKRSGQS